MIFWKYRRIIKALEAQIRALEDENHQLRAALAMLSARRFGMPTV